MKKEYLVFTVILIWILSLVGVYVFAAKPNPGHSWSEMECNDHLCVTTDGIKTKNISLGSSSSPVTANIGYDAMRRIYFGIKQGTALTKYIEVNPPTTVSGQMTFSVNGRIKIQDGNKKSGIVQMACDGTNCYAVYAP